MAGSSWEWDSGLAGGWVVMERRLVSIDCMLGHKLGVMGDLVRLLLVWRLCGTGGKFNREVRN